MNGWTNHHHPRLWRNTTDTPFPMMMRQTTRNNSTMLRIQTNHDTLRLWRPWTSNENQIKIILDSLVDGSCRSLPISILSTTFWLLLVYQHRPWTPLLVAVTQAPQNIHRLAAQQFGNTNLSICSRPMFYTSERSTCTLWSVQRIAV